MSQVVKTEVTMGLSPRRAVVVQHGSSNHQWMAMAMVAELSIPGKSMSDWARLSEDRRMSNADVMRLQAARLLPELKGSELERFASRCAWAHDANEHEKLAVALRDTHTEDAPFAITDKVFAPIMEFVVRRPVVQWELVAAAPAAAAAAAGTPFIRLQHQASDEVPVYRLVADKYRAMVHGPDGEVVVVPSPTAVPPPVHLVYAKIGGTAIALPCDYPLPFGESDVAMYKGEQKLQLTPASISTVAAAAAAATSISKGPGPMDSTPFPRAVNTMRVSTADGHWTMAVVHVWGTSPAVCYTCDSITQIAAPQKGRAKERSSATYNVGDKWLISPGVNRGRTATIIMITYREFVSKKIPTIWIVGEVRSTEYYRGNPPAACSVTVRYINLLLFGVSVTADARQMGWSQYGTRDVCVRYSARKLRCNRENRG
jgi:hypothetical protein